ncbi:tetratricopeptide repeat protein [Ammoniphilus sp. CFH 90114]|uniref:tetratricopeptide repeat protein n=1 Tax=Ammoniphilus sp. CFH 90114 TaxID=2493665 RepID=UPI00100DB137|nr:tetratricopeptide repeat protein [Ammoniphilus sp. CFH 90114]RXT13937.1 tetratricopeptide repeat protein [Ammoniphilus sp. CFH 90114]
MNAGKEFIKEAYRAIFQKDYHKAIELFKKAISRDANNATYYYKLSITYARNNNLVDAMESIQQAIRICPDNPLYRNHKVFLEGRKLAKEALLKVERGEEVSSVLPLLEKSIELDPINTQSRLLYALVLKKEGMVEDAIDALKELITLDPWHRDAKELLKSCLVEED